MKEGRGALHAGGSELGLHLALNHHKAGTGEGVCYVVGRAEGPIQRRRVADLQLFIISD